MSVSADSFSSQLWAGTHIAEIELLILLGIALVVRHDCSLCIPVAAPFYSHERRLY